MKHFSIVKKAKVFFSLDSSLYSHEYIAIGSLRSRSRYQRRINRTVA